MSLVEIKSNTQYGSGHSAADHDANCPCMTIASYLRDTDTAFGATQPPVPAKANEQAKNIFDPDQINYLHKIQEDPNAVFVAPAPAQREGSSISQLDNEMFGNFKDVAQQAIRSNSQSSRRKTKRMARKRIPEFLVSQINSNKAARQQQLQDFSSEPENHLQIGPSFNRQFNSGAYEQFQYRSYKQFQSGQYDPNRPSIQSDESAPDYLNADQGTQPEYSPSSRSSCSFLSKAAGERSSTSACDHQNLFKIVGVSAAAFAVVTWALIIFSAAVKSPASVAVPAPRMTLTSAPPIPMYGQRQPALAYKLPPDSSVYVPGETALPCLTQPTVETMNTMGTVAPPMTATSVLREQNAIHASSSLLSHMFAWLAFGLFCLGATVFCFTYGLFSPSGSLNVSEKAKYIPSPFRAEHDRLLSSLNRPLLAGGLPLGQRTEWKPWAPWRPKLISLTPAMRSAEPHTLIIGQRRTGKTRMMTSMIKHDIESRDRTVVVIDTKGDLVDSISDWIFYKDHRGEINQKIITINPERPEDSIKFNPLLVPADGDWLSVATAVVNGFKAIYSEPPGAKAAWSAQTANILRNATLLLLANGQSLSDLPRLLNDNDYRDALLDTIEKKRDDRVEYSTLLTTWSQYKKLARTDEWINWVEPILNRITPLLSDVRLREMMNAQDNNIDLIKSINEKSIILVRLPRATFGQSANLIGSLIVTAIRRGAMSQYEDSKRRSDIALYVDEFDNIVDKDTIELLSLEKTKLRIGLTAACKTLQNFPEDFRNMLTVSFGNIACFALAKKDADMLGPQMFRVDGRKIKHRTVTQFFNRANSSPQFELVSDEEKLNMDRIVGQNVHQFFFYIVSSKAGVFSLKTHDWVPAHNAVSRSEEAAVTMDSIRAIICNVCEILRHKIATAMLA